MNVIDLEILGLFFEVVGIVMIAITALGVHHHVLKEHKIDADVFQQMKKEQVIGFTGVSLAVLGFIFQIIGRISS